jgi:hypothetical protein
VSVKEIYLNKIVEIKKNKNYKSTKITRCLENHMPQRSWSSKTKIGLRAVGLEKRSKPA